MEEGSKPRGGTTTYGIYKYGQGYWVRMLSAVLGGVVTLSAAAWAWNQPDTLFTIPKSGWLLPAVRAKGVIKPGQTIQAIHTTPEKDELIGNAEVTGFTTEGTTGHARIIIKPVELTPEAIVAKRTEQDINAVRTPPDAPGEAFSAGVERPQGIDKFDKLYLKGGLGGLVLLVGFILTYRFVALSPKTVDFLIATDGEMKKVNWSTKKIIRDSTTVVIGATAIIALALFFFDLSLQLVMRAIGVLPK